MPGRDSGRWESMASPIAGTRLKEPLGVFSSMPTRLVVDGKGDCWSTVTDRDAPGKACMGSGTRPANKDDSLFLDRSGRVSAEPGCLPRYGCVWGCGFARSFWTGKINPLAVALCGSPTHDAADQRFAWPSTDVSRQDFESACRCGSYEWWGAIDVAFDRARGIRYHAVPEYFHELALDYPALGEFFLMRPVP